MPSHPPHPPHPKVSIIFAYLLNTNHLLFLLSFTLCSTSISKIYWEKSRYHLLRYLILLLKSITESFHMKFFHFLLFIIGLTSTLTAQKAAQYQPACIGFYNLENLFDTLDTPDVRDTEFSPKGSKNYGSKLYGEKLDHLAQVISEIGTELTPDGAAILGVAEIENKSVLEDLVAHPKLASRNYAIVHYDSPDRRGIDVALLYQPKYFKVMRSDAIPAELYAADSSRILTRDILWVTGNFDGEIIHLLVNHWPSRRGGAAASAPLRNACAKINKEVIASITSHNKNAKVIVMGDFNDDPVNESLKNVLIAKRKKNQVGPGGIYNPMENYYKKGIGSNAYRDAWSLFDQMLFTSGWLDEEQSGYFFKQAKIYNKPYLTQKTGQYKGYPFRTFVGDAYLGGYSDHFPVYSFFLKKV